MKALLTDVMKHLKDDRADFKKEAAQDTKMIKKIKKSMKPKKRMVSAGKKAARKLKHEVAEGKKEMKIEKVMREYKKGQLHSGSKKGPKVTSRKQAVAIALSEGRKAARKKKK